MNQQMHICLHTIRYSSDFKKVHRPPETLEESCSNRGMRGFPYIYMYECKQKNMYMYICTDLSAYSRTRTYT